MKRRNEKDFGCEESADEDKDMEDACCSDCPYYCPMCQECMYEDECGE